MPKTNNAARRRHLYAVKYLDENGAALWGCWVETMTEYAPGDVAENAAGQKFVIEYEL